MKRLTACLTVLGIWVLASLLAIAYIGDRPYLGLGIALLGGIAFGVVAFLSYEEERRAGARERGSGGAEEWGSAGAGERGSVHLCTSAPRLLCTASTSAPLHLCTSAPQPSSSSAPLPLSLFAAPSIRRLGWLIIGLLALAGLALGYWAWTTRNTATVIVEWSTASELNTAGFNLYRSDSPDGPFTRLNEYLIPASPDPLLGSSYAFTDTNVVAGRTYYYQLEDVETGGATTRHGPIAAKAEASGKVMLLAAALLGGALLGLVVVGYRAGRLRFPAQRR